MPTQSSSNDLPRGPYITHTHVWNKREKRKRKIRGEKKGGERESVLSKQTVNIFCVSRKNCGRIMRPDSITLSCPPPTGVLAVWVWVWVFVLLVGVVAVAHRARLVCLDVCAPAVTR